MVENTKRFECYVSYQPSNSSRALTRMVRPPFYGRVTLQTMACSVSSCRKTRYS